MSRTRSGSNEGIDLYRVQPASQVQREMIETGRVRETSWLTHFCSGAENKVKFMTELTDGSVLLDKFRVTSGRVSGFFPGELRMLERRYQMVERSGERVALVTVQQSSYDKRIACFDFAPKACCTAFFLMIFIVFLLDFAYELNLILTPYNSHHSWLHPILNGTAAAKYSSDASVRFETL